jgi:LacI family transcriptional regulator
MTIITIKDVAARAGVSPKTVSRVINGESYVRAELREAVQKVVDELGYRPNAFARGLSSSRSFLIGLFFDDPASGYAADVQRGALGRCRALSYHLVIEQVEHDRADWLARSSPRPCATGPSCSTCSISTRCPSSASHRAIFRAGRRRCR